MVELLVPGTILKVGCHRLETQERRGFEGAGKERELELVEGIKGSAPMLDRAPPPLQWILDSLEGDKGVDPAHGAQANCRACRLRSVWLGQGKAAGPARPPGWCGRRGGSRCVGA